MQKYMNYIQPQILDYNLSIIEWMILDYIMRAFSWANPKQIDWIMFVQLHPQKILDDLPLLWIKTKNWLNKHINKLIASGLLNKKISGNAPYYAITDLTKDYIFAGGKQLDAQVPTIGTIGVNDWTYNSNINNSNIKYITIPIDQVKKKSKTLAGQLENILSSLVGKTDLEDVDYKSIIELWNSYNKSNRLPAINLSNPNSVMVKSISKKWAEFKKTYTKEEFNVWLQNYLTDISKRKPDWKVGSYYDHRFTLYQFLWQANWIKKFMALWEDYK